MREGEIARDAITGQASMRSNGSPLIAFARLENVTAQFLF